MELNDARERKGDKLLYQHPSRCEHPREWCIRRTSILDQIYYHCYKCGTDVNKDLVGTAPWSRREKMTGYVYANYGLDTYNKVGLGG
jgi:hypothetical protein